jgi:hypothetical protein
MIHLDDFQHVAYMLRSIFYTSLIDDIIEV